MFRDKDWRSCQNWGLEWKVSLNGSPQGGGRKMGHLESPSSLFLPLRTLFNLQHHSALLRLLRLFYSNGDNRTIMLSCSFTSMYDGELYWDLSLKSSKVVGYKISRNHPHFLGFPGNKGVCPVQHEV
jgi:hypothetical protein